MKTVVINNRAFQFSTTTGKVVQASKNMEIQVTGRGGGGTSGYTAPVHINSTTIVHDQIFLLHPDGRESSFQLKGMNVACRDGNELSITCVSRPGKDKSECIGVVNRTTGNAYYNVGRIRGLHLPPEAHALIGLGAVFASAMLLGSGPIGALLWTVFLGTVLVAIYSGIMSQRATNAFISKFKPDDYE
jgi:hypothetical protein